MLRTMLACVFCVRSFSTYAEWYEHTMIHLIRDAEIDITKTYNVLVDNDIYALKYD